MAFSRFFTKASSPSAQVAGGRLVLSLPDAETPVVWVMDLGEASSAVLRLENDKNGFCVIRKHSGKSAVETVAVYRDRRAAETALARASRALEAARGNVSDKHVIVRSSWLTRFSLGFLTIWFMLYLGGLDGLALRLALSPFFGSSVAQQSVASAEGAQQAPAAAAADTVGVPVSADAFLRGNAQKLKVP